MNQTVLENGRLLVEINQHGSELARIYDKKKEREVLWNGDPSIWGRRAPVLFPFIGKCVDGAYLYQGQEYAMTPHGFARDSDFRLLTSNDSEVWYGLTDSEASYKSYPFHFNLEIGHRLEDAGIAVSWKVTNMDDKEMLFMIGGHPAFRTPKGKTIYDFTLDFHGKEQLRYQAPNQDGYGDKDKQGKLHLNSGKIMITKGFFEEALTYIFDQAQVEAISLLLPGGEPYVTVHCKGIPFLGVWTMEKTHPFVCLEPWFGRCADKEFKGELKDREGILTLEAGECFQAEYTIEIH